MPRAGQVVGSGGHLAIGLAVVPAERPPPSGRWLSTNHCTEVSWMRRSRPQSVVGSARVGERANVTTVRTRPVPASSTPRRGHRGRPRRRTPGHHQGRERERRRHLAAGWRRSAPPTGDHAAVAVDGTVSGAHGRRRLDAEAGQPVEPGGRRGDVLVGRVGRVDRQAPSTARPEITSAARARYEKTSTSAESCMATWRWRPRSPTACGAATTGRWR